MAILQDEKSSIKLEVSGEDLLEFSNELINRARSELSAEYIVDQYLHDDHNIPWIIGFSGGKDSTVLLTLTWKALQRIRERWGNEKLVRSVYVVNNDTLVENPIITDYVLEVLGVIENAAQEQRLPIKVIPIIQEIKIP